MIMHDPFSELLGRASDTLGNAKCCEDLFGNCQNLPLTEQFAENPTAAWLSLPPARQLSLLICMSLFEGAWSHTLETMRGSTNLSRLLDGATLGAPVRGEIKIGGKDTPVWEAPDFLTSRGSRVFVVPMSGSTRAAASAGARAQGADIRAAVLNRIQPAAFPVFWVLGVQIAAPFAAIALARSNHLAEEALERALRERQNSPDQSQ